MAGAGTWHRGGGGGRHSSFASACHKLYHNALTFNRCHCACVCVHVCVCISTPPLPPCTTALPSPPPLPLLRFSPLLQASFREFVRIIFNTFWASIVGVCATTSGRGGMGGGGDVRGGGEGVTATSAVDCKWNAS